MLSLDIIYSLGPRPHPLRGDLGLGTRLIDIELGTLHRWAEFTYDSIIPDQHA